jgi:hypothetical protein
MRPSSIILGLILVVHSTARPTTTVQPRQNADTTSELGSFPTQMFPTIPPDIPTTPFPTQMFPTIPPDIPTPTPTPSSSCGVVNSVLFDTFVIVIATPYVGPSDCDATYHALESKTWGITLWKCERTTYDYILLMFNCVDLEGQDISVILNSRYPHAIGPVDCPSD